jgi:hypothetical protein
MEILSIAIISFIVRLVISSITARRVQVVTITPARQSICLHCVHAHIARGFKASEELTNCTYAGVSREVKFAVSDCSMFCHRNAQPEIVRVIGFADMHVGHSLRPSIAAEAERLTN